MIPIEQIRIVNPRHRDAKKFEPIVESIKTVGLKKPIQVRRRGHGENGEAGYDLVCGQGRIEAFVALGYKEIPAIVMEVPPEEGLLRSLVENIARRHPSPQELIREIERLREAGYSIQQVANKLGVSDNTVKGMSALKRAGEQRLLEAALDGTVPLWVAIDIAKTDSPEAQREMLKAFETKQLNHLSIRVVKRLMDQRRFLGKEHHPEERGPERNRPTAQNLVSAYKRESQRQKEFVRKARTCEDKLLFIVTAFGKLLANEGFLALLHAEALDTIPQFLWSKLNLQPKESL